MAVQICAETKRVWHSCKRCSLTYTCINSNVLSKLTILTKCEEVQKVELEGVRYPTLPQSN